MYLLCSIKGAVELLDSNSLVATKVGYIFSNASLSPARRGEKHSSGAAPGGDGAVCRGRRDESSSGI